MQLNKHDVRALLWQTLWMMPIIYVILMVKRFLLMIAFRPLFRAVRGDIVSCPARAPARTPPAAQDDKAGAMLAICCTA